jgi:GNAT superfamily N-acetyltransferase
MSRDDLFDRLTDFLDRFFARMRAKPVDVKNPFKNRILYKEYHSHLIKLMVSSTTSTFYVDGVLTTKWGFKIVQIQVYPEFRRQGVATALLNYCKEHCPADYLMVESAITDDMVKFMTKYADASMLQNYNDWYIKI